MDNEGIKEILSAYMPLIVVLAVWEAVWKLLGMWRAGRNNQPVWFICIALINTLGILPIVYLVMQKKARKDVSPRHP